MCEGQGQRSRDDRGGELRSELGFVEWAETRTRAMTTPREGGGEIYSYNYSTFCLSSLEVIVYSNSIFVIIKTKKKEKEKESDFAFSVCMLRNANPIHTPIFLKCLKYLPIKNICFPSNPIPSITSDRFRYVSYNVSYNVFK